MTRLIIFWSRPLHLSDHEAETWAREEVGRLLAIEGVRCGELTRLRDASSEYGRDRDWMLELRLTAGTDAQQCVDHGACSEWLGDLRLLGMRPSVLLAEEGTVLRREVR
jgi:hypothetical protein